MGFLNNTSCYLVGPIEFDSKLGCDWRNGITPRLKNMGVKIYNPLDRPNWLKVISPYTPPNAHRHEVLDMIENCSTRDEWMAPQTLVRDTCLRYVSTCDFVICNLPETKTYGSIEEIVKANDMGKPIIAICRDRMPSLWMLDVLKDQFVFDDFDDALKFLEGVDAGTEILNALRWIFIEDNYGDGKSL